jgi:hypothetical protein
VPIFRVVFTREFEATVEADNRAEVVQAASAVTTREIDHDWDKNGSEWEAMVYQDELAPDSKTFPDMGALGGKLVAHYDYRHGKKGP